MQDWGIKSTTTRLELSDGNWIDVKDELSVRDERDRVGYASDGVSSDGQTYRINATKFEIAQAAVYIVNWSATRNGQPWAWLANASFKDRVAVIESLPKHALEAISRAIGAHARESKEADADSKNASAGGGVIASEATSPSAS